MNVSTKKSLAYELNALIIYEIDDNITVIFMIDQIAKFPDYYIYDTSNLNKCCWMIKHNVMNRFKWNIININQQYVLINLLYVVLLYQIIWSIISVFRVFIIKKCLAHHCCIEFDCVLTKKV